MILVSKAKDKTVPSTIRLADAWLPSRSETDGRIVAQGALWAFADKISASRREGKNRRDGATVQSRVLSLADVVGEALWADGVVAEEKLETEELVKAKKKGASKRKSMTAVSSRL